MQALQSINLFLLVFFGFYSGHLYLSLDQIGGLLLFGVIVEHLILYLKEGSVTYFSISSMTTVLGVVLMMVALKWWVYGVVIVAGLLQKHTIQVGGRHLFNPSNFALIVGLSLFYHDTHIVLGQLGDATWLIGVTIGLGAVVLWVADRWVIPILFLGSYLLLEYLCVVSTDPVMRLEDLMLRLYSVSFIVFVLFMLTDPRTTPDALLKQALFAVGVSIVAVGLDYGYGVRVQHLFLALFGVTALFGTVEGLQREPKATLRAWVLLVIVVWVIVYIERQPPYYFVIPS